MGKYEVVEEIEMRTRGGAGGSGDDSDNLDDMGYAERLVMNPDFLGAMASLKVAYVDGNTIKGGSILVKRPEIEGYPGKEISGAAHAVNRVFTALEAPFYATSYSSDDAEKITRVAKRGKDVGKSKNVTIPDMLRVYRISETYEPDRYAVNDSKKVTEEGIKPYHEATEGMKARELKWIEENGTNPEIYDILVKCGIDVAVEEVTPATAEAATA